MAPLIQAPSSSQSAPKMFDIFHEFSFINLLSISAFFTTVGLFFCGIPICRQIWKRQDTTEISGAPFLMGVLGGMCWFSYGMLKGDQTVMWVTGAQMILYSTYTVFYFFMTRKKFWISVKIAILVVTCTVLIGAVHLFGQAIYDPLGVVCMTLNIADFAAPLAGLRVVIRRRATSTLPLPLCIANFMVSTEWALYGLLVKDFYLIFPNGVGSALAFSQVLLFVVLPRKPNQRIPILRLMDFVRRQCGGSDRVMDIEAAAVVPAAEKQGGIGVGLGIGEGLPSITNPTNPDHHPNNNESMSRRSSRWSTRVISNVADEIENVMHKVHLADQFAYSSRLNAPKEEDVCSSESDTLTPDQSPTTPVTATSTATANDTTSMMMAPSIAGSHKTLVFPMTIRDESQLMQLSQRLSTANLPAATSLKRNRSRNHRPGNGGMGSRQPMDFSASYSHPPKFYEPFSSNTLGGPFGDSFTGSRVVALAEQNEEEEEDEEEEMDYSFDYEHEGDDKKELAAVPKQLLPSKSKINKQKKEAKKRQGIKRCKSAPDLGED